MATATQLKTARACRLLGESKALAALSQEKAAEGKALAEELLPEGEKGKLESRSYGTISRTYQDRLSISSTAEDKLRELLGESFPDYVKASVSLSPTKRLKEELLASGDSETASLVRPLVEIRHSPVVRFTPAPGVDFAMVAVDELIKLRRAEEQAATEDDKAEEAA